MRIAQVIGTVTLSKPHPSLIGGRLLVAIPASLAALAQRGALTSEEMIVWDELGAGTGSWIGVTEGVEATMPFRPERKPIDAYCACLVDDLFLDAQSLQELLP